MKLKNLILGLMVALTPFGLALEANANNYPNKPITLYCPYGPGGDTDLSARVWADFASKELGQPVLVVNKIGGGGLSGTLFATQQKADGYNLFIGQPGSCITLPLLAPNSGVKQDSFEFLSRFAITNPGAVVKADAPWKNIKDFHEDAIKAPNKFISSGSSATSYVALLFTSWLMQNDVKLKTVEYNSAAESATAVLGGHGDITFVYKPNFASMVDAGELKLLVLGAKDPKYPDVPTFNELGYPGNYYGWSGIVIPNGAPQEIKDKLIAVSEKINKDPEFLKALNNLGFKPDNTSGEEFKKSVNAQYNEMKTVLTNLGLIK